MCNRSAAQRLARAWRSQTVCLDTEGMAPHRRPNTWHAEIVPSSPKCLPAINSDISNTLVDYVPLCSHTYFCSDHICRMKVPLMKTYGFDGRCTYSDIFRPGLRSARICRYLSPYLLYLLHFPVLPLFNVLVIDPLPTLSVTWNELQYCHSIAGRL
jgi:hypothetical protein